MPCRDWHCPLHSSGAMHPSVLSPAQCTRPSTCHGDTRPGKASSLMLDTGGDGAREAEARRDVEKGADEAELESRVGGWSW